EKAIAQRFGGAKFIASGTTAALDDVLKRKYSKLQELLGKNMTAISKAYDLVKAMVSEGAPIAGRREVTCTTQRA
ncbi:MAG: hypothetical protein KGZ35_06910, partial [Truepera sp.]|nr:hypothetical protein [Truepera sp.]